MIIIIDGNQLACRCYFSLNTGKNSKVLTNSKGKRTETIYSFLSSFKKIIKDYGNDDTIYFLTWDGGNDLRKKIYPEYKSGRKPFEYAFYEQLRKLREIIDLLGVKQYYYTGVEADDLIGTLTLKSRKKGKKVLIISSDHDFEQLISRHVEVLHPLGNNIIKDVNFVLDKYGLSPDRIPEVMAITGDDTDNIPGIDGVGEKTASRLILANGSLKNIIDCQSNLKILNKKNAIVDASEDLNKKIKENIESIKIAFQLVTIRTNLDIEPDFNTQKKDFVGVKNIFEELEFKQFLNEFDSWKTAFRS